MHRYWLMDRHGAEGPTALVETDGSMHIVSVLRFGPDITELTDQQAIFDQVIGRLAPTMRPLVDAATIDEEGVDPHADLWLGEHGSSRSAKRAGRGSAGGRARGVGRPGSGPDRKGSRGDR